MSFVIRALDGNIVLPPDFFAPNRLPGPSLAPFARPWDRDVEFRMAVMGLRDAVDG